MFQTFKSYLQRFISINEREWLDIVQCLEVKKLKRHQKLLSENETCRTLAFVVSGALRTCYTLNGDEVTFYFFFEQSVATDYESFITQTPTNFAIEAIEDSDVLLLHYPDAQRLFSTLAEGQKLARYIAEGLFIAQRQRTFSLLLETPEERYLGLINGKSELLQRVNQYYIASYLGIKPQSLSRIRKRLLP